MGGDVTPLHLFRLLRESAVALDHAGAVLSAQVAAHAHLAAASRTAAAGPLRYSALAPRRVTAVYPGPSRVSGFDEDSSPVAQILQADLAFFTVTVTIDAIAVRVISREAALAQLLAEAGLSIALAGSVLKVAGSPPIDVDQVREILKAARLGDRFQPMLELVDTI